MNNKKSKGVWDSTPKPVDSWIPKLTKLASKYQCKLNDSVAIVRRNGGNMQKDVQSRLLTYDTNTINISTWRILEPRKQGKENKKRWESINYKGFHHAKYLLEAKGFKDDKDVGIVRTRLSQDLNSGFEKVQNDLMRYLKK